MKLTPFLFEVSAEALTKFYKDKFIPIFQNKEYTDQVDDLYQEGIFEYHKDINKAFNVFLDIIFSTDPTKGKDYSRWLVERWFAQGFKLEDKDKVRECLELFHVHKKNLPIKDIGRIKSSGELFKILKDAGVIGVSVSGINPAELQQLTQSKDIKFMGDLPKWLIYVPITVKGSCYLGKETEWCTAKYKEDDERNMFNYYNKDGELWVFINKNPSGAEPTKIQIHFDSSQIMDQNDQEIDKDILQQNYPEIVEFLRQQTKQDKQTVLFTEFWDDEIKLGVLTGNIQYHGQFLIIDDFVLNQEIWNSVNQDLVDNGGRLNFSECIFNNIDFGTKLPRKFHTCKLDGCKIHLYQKTTLNDCVVSSCQITRDDGYDSNIFIDGSKFTDTTIVECDLTGTEYAKFYQCSFTYKFSLGHISNCDFNKCNFTEALGEFYKCGFVQCNFSQQMFKQASYSYTASEIAETFKHCSLDNYTKQQIPYSEVIRENKIKPSLATLLFEMPMKTVPEVHKENIAMLVHKKHQHRRDYVALILYKINNEDIQNKGRITIIGRISASLNSQCKAFEISQSAAEQNYGPLLYDMLMSLTNGYIIPDTGGISPSAQKVWDKMLSMPEKYQVVDTPNCGKKVKILQPVSDYKQLINNHVANADYLRKIFPTGYEERLIDLSREYFRSKYEPSWN